MSAAERIVLKQSVKRTVSLESSDGGGRVVKRFHAPGRLDRLLDGRRARREHGRLLRIRERGLRAPRPIAVRRSDGRWELVTEFVEGATVSELLHAGGPWPGGIERVARRLGRELAHAFARGVDHADLHPGNILLDREGRPWWIDAARCRVGAVPGAERMRTVLVDLAAGSREHLEPLARALFLSAFLRALEPDAARAFGPRAPFALELEDRARLHRRDVLEARAARWLRESGAVEAHDRDGVRTLVRRGATAARPVREITFTGDPVAAWLTAARLTMHGVPCARPLRLTLGALPSASFELDFVPAPFPRGAELTRRAWRTLGASLGTLHDRALTWSAIGPDTLAVEPAHLRASWLPGVRLTAFAVAPRERRAALSDLADAHEVGPATRAAFLVGYLAAQRHSARERALLRTELTRG